MQRLVHFLLCFAGTLVWGVGNVFYMLAFLFAYLADKVEPESTMGNCWSFAMVKYLKYGGYLLCRPADGQRFLKIFPVPHVLWVEKLDRKTVLEQFYPVVRKGGTWVPWHTVYYKGQVRKAESPHNAKSLQQNSFSSEAGAGKLPIIRQKEHDMKTVKLIFELIDEKGEKQCISVTEWKGLDAQRVLFVEKNILGGIIAMNTGASEMLAK